MVGLALILGTSTNLFAKSDATDKGAYTEKDKEFYLTEDQIAFIRPGLDVEVLDIVIPEDFRPLVTFSLKDPGGMPLDIDGIFTPGPVDMRFTLTRIPLGEEQKVRYTESTRDRDGTYESLGDGVYTYKFTTVLPDTYEVDATHTLGAIGRRDLTEFGLDRYVDNEVHNFVPSGMFDPIPRDVVTTETCNGRCHDPLAMHGARYVEIGICSQCHNPGLVGRNDGFSKSLNVLIHQKHNELEEGYPALLNDCEICHTGGVPTENFPLVAGPNPASVCDGTATGVTTLDWEHTGRVEIRLDAADGKLFAKGAPTGSKETGKWVRDGKVFVLLDAASGEVLQELPVNTTVLGCTTNAPGTFRGAPGAQHTNWLDHPSRLVCGACHDDVDFATGEGHAGGAQQDDDVCGICHAPGSGQVFDRSIRGAHKPLYKSPQFPGLLVEVIEVTDTNPGDTPTVTFSLNSKEGTLHPAGLNRLRFTIVGPNEDFSFYAQETVGSAAVKAGDNWAYTFETPLPADAAGSYSVGFEGRNEVTVDLGEGESVERDQAQNTMFAFAVTDDVAVPRRMVVDDAKCESCHANLSLHGGNRHNPQYCNTCHKPDLVDIADIAENVSFKWMSHKIHRGEELENGYVVVRSRGTFDFGHIEFPGDLRNCEKCHVNDSYMLPLPDGLLPATTPNQWWDPIEPMAAACLSCHDSDDANAHAFTNTTYFGESCATCHGEGKAFSVEKVHAR